MLRLRSEKEAEMVLENKDFDSISRKRNPGGREGIFGPLLASFRHPELWLSLAFLANVLEGALRKWVSGFEGGVGRALAYFSKDLLLMMAIVLILGRGKRQGKVNETVVAWGGAAVVFVLIGAGVSTIQEINPVGAVMSLRALVFLPLLAFAISSRINGGAIQGFAIMVGILAIGNAILGFTQMSLPVSHEINKYATEMDFVAEWDGKVRAAGTFAYILGLVTFSSAGVWAGLVLISLARSAKLHIAGIFALFAGLGCGFATQSRGTLVIAMMMIGLWSISSIRTLRAAGVASIVGMGVLLVSMAAVPAIWIRIEEAASGSFKRFSEAGDSNVLRTFGQFEELYMASVTHPLGRGLGTEQVAGNYAATGQMIMKYEAQFPRLVSDVGLLGFIGFCLLCVMFILSLERTKSTSSGSRWNSVVVATQVYLVGQLYGNYAFNHTGSAMAVIIWAAVLSSRPRVQRPRWKRDRPLRGKIENLPEELSEASV